MTGIHGQVVMKKRSWLVFGLSLCVCLSGTLIAMTYSYDFGKHQTYLDGVKLGPIMDIYREEIVSREHHLLDFWPDPGDYKLRLESVGKNSKSAGHYLGIESIRLRERRPRVRKYGHDADKDRRKKPVLYR